MQSGQKIVYGELKFFWEDELWLEYISREDIACVIAELLEGMDEVSHVYVQTYIHMLKLLPYKKHVLVDKNYGWTDTDIALAQYLVASCQLEEQEKEAFMYANTYGMKDVPQEVLASINGTCIVDGGAYTGDTLFLFHNLFPQSRIFAFEPQNSAFEQLQTRIQAYSTPIKAVPVCRGLSDIEEELTLYTGEHVDAGATCNALAICDKVPTDTIKTTTIDTVFKSMNAPVGLIKLDIEGLEMKALEGAKQTIQKYKPVIVAAIYHRPQDFFELKSYIKNIHPEYRFMIRRSDMVIPMADLVLIAY